MEIPIEKPVTRAGSPSVVDIPPLDPPGSITKRSILRPKNRHQAQFPLATDPQQAYGLGLYSFHLPPHEINIVTNTHAIETVKTHTICANSPPRRFTGHTGDLQDFTNAYWTFPEESESAVVAMTNTSSAYSDPSNIVGHVLIQGSSDLQLAGDVEHTACEAVSQAKAQWQRVVDNWKSRRLAGTQPHELSAYVCTHTCTDLRMALNISLVEEENASNDHALRLSISGHSD